MKLTTVGVDIAKSVMQLYYIDAETGEIVNKPVKRVAFLEHFANRSPCLIGMEACGGSQHWARNPPQTFNTESMAAKTPAPFI